MSGADEILDLARDLGKAPAAVVSGVYEAYRGVGEGFRDDWKRNVDASSPGGHLKHLPDAITTEMRTAGLTSIEVETGPESGRRQGRMGVGDEFGSQNQPPHLNGLRAMQTAEQRLERAADAAVGLALP